MDTSSLVLELDCSVHEDAQVVLSIDDLKSTLRRRGPDSLGSKKLFLHATVSRSYEECKVVSFIEEEDLQRDVEKEDSFLRHCKNRSDLILNADRESHEVNHCSIPKSVAELHFFGATLQLRGISPILQPLMDNYGNILIYNGEIFGGIHVDMDSNDAEVLMKCLGEGKSCVPEILSSIKGPWAVIYWQDSLKTMWFGRDAFGRRSLLVHWPSVEDSRLLLSSVSPPSSGDMISVENGKRGFNFWEELSCGIYSIHIDVSKTDGCLVGEVKKHDWTNLVLKELIEWDRAVVEPKPEDLCSSCIKSPKVDLHSVCSERVPSDIGPKQTSISVPAHTVLIALRESVMRRTAQNTVFQAVAQKEHIPVAVLFSGGLDSMILAALLDECLDPSYEIDLLNVSFDGDSAPDRISARAGLMELRRIAPSRRWKLVEINADLSKLTSEKKHVMLLINPSKTYMDLNIGLALWLAAGGDGWLYEELSNNNNNEHPQHVRYKSEARILLVGSGADEQCAGYGRHRTKYRQGSWIGLHEEMRLDMQRIWKRNLGRDDRCIADNGKEARFPFLDEDVIKTLLEFPLWEIADLDQPSGKGDKKILREVAQLIGLREAAFLPKRAIQFGSRIARESNRENFGSNRAANQASAGSVVFDRSSIR